MTRLRDLSLKRKVPLYIGAGLLVVLAAWTWLAYRGVRDAVRAVGEQRVQAVTDQIVSVYQANAQTLGRNWRNTNRNGAMVDFVQHGTTRSRDSALALFKRQRTAQNYRVDLFALDGTPILSSTGVNGRVSGERHEELANEFVKASKGPEFYAIAPIRVLDDSVVLPIVAAVLRDSEPVGFSVLWRRVAATEQARAQFAGLLGNKATMYIGNARGDVWSDVTGTLVRFAAAPPVGGAVARYVRQSDQERVTAASRAINGTPWAITIEFADATILAPASRFLRWSVIAGAIVLIVATSAAALLSRRLVTPIADLSAATTAIAAGDYSRPLRADRGDEIGQLASAFNLMANRIALAHNELEARVGSRTAELQERNEELEAFAHSVSHDLRAPLRAMHGFSQALIEDHGAELSATAQDYARRIANASHRMDALTQDLLAYSRVSRTDMPVGDIDLNGVVRGAVAQLQADIDGRHARVTVEPLPRAIAHGPVLEQALANLIANGIKFVAPDRVPEVRVHAERINGAVRVWIHDNGIGIDRAHHARIFNVFERLHSPDEYAGTGIGLAIVRKGIERMGGRVGVESAPGAGSRFWIELQSAETTS